MINGLQSPWELNLRRLDRSYTIPASHLHHPWKCLAICSNCDIPASFLHASPGTKILLNKREVLVRHIHLNYREMTIQNTSGIQGESKWYLLRSIQWLPGFLARRIRHLGNRVSIIETNLICRDAPEGFDHYHWKPLLRESLDSSRTIAKLFIIYYCFYYRYPLVGFIYPVGLFLHKQYQPDPVARFILICWPFIWPVSKLWTLVTLASQSESPIVFQLFQRK